jgi:hypothetical protein
MATACMLAMRPSSAGETPEGAGYRIASSTLDGGTPQVSSHAPSGYRIAGSIGQPDAAVSVAGTLRLEGGFWPAPLKDTSVAIFADSFE